MTTHYSCRLPRNLRCISYDPIIRFVSCTKILECAIRSAASCAPRSNFRRVMAARAGELANRTMYQMGIASAPGVYTEDWLSRSPLPSYSIPTAFS